VCDEGCEDIEGAVKKLSLASTSTLSDHDLNIVDLITPENPDLETNSKMHSVQSRIKSYLQSIDVLERNSLSQKSSSMLVCDEGCEGIEGAIKKLSLASTSTLSDHDYGDPLAALLAVCGQSVPLTLLEVFSKLILACSFSHCAAALFPYKMLLHIFILF
jgi:serine/threonine-protein kinase haspin